VKVLYLITKSNWGGAQRHVFDLAVQAKKEGFETMVALGGNGILRSKLTEAGVSTIPIETLGRDVHVGKDASSFTDIWRIIKLEKPDILHLHSPKAGGLGALAGRLIRARLFSTKKSKPLFPKKIIYTAHGWAWNESRPFYQKTVIAFFSWLTMLLSTEIITLSKKETNQALAFPFVKNKIHHIPLGITPPIFYGRVNALDFIEKRLNENRPAENENMDKNTEKNAAENSTKNVNEHKKPAERVPLERRPVIGTISELHPNKGLIYLIKAAVEIKKKFPTLAIVIIGDGELRPALEALIKKLDLADTVYLAGYIDQASQYIKAFTIFSLTSVKEGLPYTIFEAAYAGVPVVATVVGGIPELINDMSSGILIQPKKPAEIAYALSFLLDPAHKTEQRSYAEALRKRIETEFPIEKMFERTFEVYRK
jgi:glycosyltransferase involved in cell wall biosynthesis